MNGIFFTHNEWIFLCRKMDGIWNHHKAKNHIFGHMWNLAYNE
jgi:hypothetical protein